MGNGDDGFSTHGAEYITGGYVWGEFARASYSAANSNGIEMMIILDTLISKKLVVDLLIVLLR